MTCLRQGAGHAFAQVISYLHAAFEGRACRADRVLRHGGENGVVRLAFTCSKECHPEKLALWNSCCGLIIALGHGQPGGNRGEKFGGRIDSLDQPLENREAMRN